MQQGAGKQKSFFGIKYGGTAVDQAPQAPAPIAEQPVAPQPPVAPVAQQDTFAVRPMPYVEAPAHPYADVPAQPQAQVIESAESAAHANGATVNEIASSVEEIAATAEKNAAVIDG